VHEVIDLTMEDSSDEIEDRPESSSAATSRRSRALRSERELVAGEDEYDPKHENIASKYANKLREWDANPVVTKLSKDELARLVSAVMRHMLFKSPTAGPVTREELVGLVNGIHKGQRNLSAYVIAVAQDKFPAAFGMEMKELLKPKPNADPRKQAAKGESSATKCFVLRSLLPVSMRRRYVHLPEDLAFQSFTMTTLALLVANSTSGGIPEDALWFHLSLLGIVKGVHHPTFGDPEQMMARLFKQRYLQKSARKVADNEQIVVDLAENASDEISKANIMKWIAEVMEHAES